MSVFRVWCRCCLSLWPNGTASQGLTRGHGCLLLNMPSISLSSAKQPLVCICITFEVIKRCQTFKPVIWHAYGSLSQMTWPWSIHRPFTDHFIITLSNPIGWLFTVYPEPSWLYKKPFWGWNITGFAKVSNIKDMQFCLRNFVTRTLQTRLYILLCVLIYGCETSTCCF